MRSHYRAMADSCQDLNTQAREISPIEGNHEVSVAGDAPHLSTRLLPDGARLVPADLNPHKRRDAAARGRLAGPLP